MRTLLNEKLYHWSLLQPISNAVSSESKAEDLSFWKRIILSPQVAQREPNYVQKIKSLNSEEFRQEGSLVTEAI